ncbi:hypothetical protein ACP70R_050131 [Stipagrostis hirtigluma subsp. patula]
MAAAAAAPAGKTASTHRVAFVEGTHQLEIVGYSALKALGRSHSVTSATFPVAGHDWAVLCGFDGHRLESLSLELSSAADSDDEDDDDGVKAISSFTILGPKGKPAAMEIVGTSREAKIFNRWSTVCSHPVPSAFDEQEARFVKDDRLTVRCTVEVFTETEEESGPIPTRNCFVAAPPPPSISRSLEKLMASGRRTDVTFALERPRGRAHAHKLVLAARSPVFRAKFFGDTMDSGERWFRVRDVRAPVFRAMLHFIYTDELPPGTCTEGSRKHRTTMAYDLLVAADLYDLERMRLMCEKTLWELSTGDVATALATLALVTGGRHNCRQLEALCVGYIAGMWDAAVKTDEYRDLKRRSPSALNDILEKVMSSSSSSSAAASSSKGDSSKKMSKSVYRSSDVSRGSHQFTIMGFSDVLRTHAVGEAVRSGNFHVGGHDWRIKCYPSGCTEETRDDIGVFLDLRTPLDANSDVRVKAQMIFTIVGPSSRLQMDASHEYSRDHRGLGYRQFVSVEDAKSEYVGQDDQLTIQCDVKVITGPSVVSSGAGRGGDQIVVPPPNISWHLEQLLETNLGSDVVFFVEDADEFFDAHATVLSVRAPALLKAGKLVKKRRKRSKRIIRIGGDITAVVFKAVLHFVYTDELPPLDDLARAAARGDDADVPVAVRKTRMAGDLLAAADRYQLPERMGLLCENLLCDVITPQTAAATLRLAERHHRPELKAFCADYISSPGVLKAVVDSEDYKHLTASSGEAEALGRIIDRIAANSS